MAGEGSTISTWKIIRWGIFACLLFMVLLLFRRPKPVTELMSSDVVKAKSESFDNKLQNLEVLHQRGEAASFHFSAEEINAALQRSLAEQLAASKGAPKGEAGSTELPPGVRATQVALEDDHATIQIAAQLMGREIYLTVSAKVGVADGHVTFDFLDGKIGNLTIPIGLLRKQLEKKLEEPDVQDKLKLPEYITGLQIEKGQLVISEK